MNAEEEARESEGENVCAVAEEGRAGVRSVSNISTVTGTVRENNRRPRCVLEGRADCSEGDWE